MRRNARQLVRRVTRRLARIATAEEAARPRPPKKKAAPSRSQPGSDAHTALLRSVQEGSPLDEAIVRQVRALLAQGDTSGAQSFAESLRPHTSTKYLGRLSCGIVAAHRGLEALAWAHLGDLPRSLWARFAAEEYVRSGLHASRAHTLSEIRDLAAENPPEMRVESWFAVFGPVFGSGEVDLAREVFATFRQRLSEEPTPRPQLSRQSEWLDPWVSSEPSSATLPRREVPTFAVIDYGHPGMNRASANIGDHVQSIASLGHLVRHQGVRLQGEEDLVDLLGQLRARTRPELLRHDVQGDLEVMTVHRDASMYEEVPEGTWVLCFGWFMHALFKMRFGFPLHQGLRPIFVSFHCNKRELLTPEAVAYLKRYGPVGCRDWTTVYLLLSVGVPAFFSGCITTTVNTVFPDLVAGPAQDAPVAYVDIPEEEVPPGAATYAHSSGVVRTRSFTANCYEALELLETYRRRHRGVVTSRLHCYLPLRSMGVPVDFQPKNRSDIRFDGLIDITDESFDTIRAGILGKLETVFSAILSGAPEEEVYATWQQLTAEDVRTAERKRDEEIRLPPVEPVIEAEVRQVREATVTVGVRRPEGDPTVVHCAVELPKGRAKCLEVLVASLAAHTSRALHVHVLADQDVSKVLKRLVSRFPELTFEWVPTRPLGRGLHTPTGATPRDLGRLLLDRLLPGVDRVLVLPVEAVVTADVSALAEIDLHGHPFAAPTTVSAASGSGFGVIHTAALRLEHRTQLSAALRRTAHARHEFDFDSFTTDVLVLDLALLRSTGFTAQATALVQEFGLDEREVLHYIAGPNHAAVPDNWSFVPTRSPATSPGLTHWADEVKPWHRQFTPDRDLWRRYAREA